MTRVIQLGKRSLALQTLPVAVAATIPAPVDHIIAIDVSGSMYSDLTELRLQLKNKLAMLVKETDTVTLIWFSGRGQCGILFEQVAIRTLRDLSELNKAIDKYLQAVGLTGFKEPIQEVSNVIDRISAKRKNSVFSLFFMTDGYDNQWSESEILDVCRKLEPKLSSATLVEYGWCANRNLLAKMAEILGGSLIFSKDLQEYQVSFEKAISGTLGVKKVPVQLDYAPALGYAFTMPNGEPMTLLPDAENVVLVPEGTVEVAYFTDVAGVPFDHKTEASPLVWAGLVTLSQRMDSDAILDVLSAMGDVALVAEFSSCFSKEDYVRFQTAVLLAATQPDARYVLGYDPAAVPKEDAYTVLELISDLTSSDENLFYPRHEAFAYERIGAGSEQRDNRLRYGYKDKSKGYPVNGIVWNEERPNVSVRVRMDVEVTLPVDDRPAVLPPVIDSYVYRNYTIVRDGIVHTRRLPVSLAQATFEKLQANGLLAGAQWAAGEVYVLDFPKVPVINRQMVSNVSAKQTFDRVLKLQLLKGAQKVFNEFRDRITPKESKKFLLLYGQEATEYLAALGVTDYNGFNPPSDSRKSGDVYLAKEMKIAVKGLSSLAKVSDVEAALLAGKKLKISEFVLVEALQRVQAFQASDIYVKASEPLALFGAWLESESKAAVKQTRELMVELAKSKFAIMVGHRWFADMPTMDDNKLDVELSGYGPVPVTATVKDVEIEK